MSKRKSKLRIQVEKETGKDFECVYEFYKFHNGRKTLCDRIYNASHKEAKAHLNELYEKHSSSAFVMEIKTLNFHDLALASS